MDWREKPDMTDEEKTVYEKIKAERIAQADSLARAEAKEYVKQRQADMYFRDAIAELSKFQGKPARVRETIAKYKRMGLDLSNVDVARAVSDYKAEQGG